MFLRMIELTGRCVGGGGGYKRGSSRTSMISARPVAGLSKVRGFKATGGGISCAQEKQSGDVIVSNEVEEGSLGVRFDDTERRRRSRGGRRTLPDGLHVRPRPPLCGMENTRRQKGSKM